MLGTNNRQQVRTPSTFPVGRYVPGCTMPLHGQEIPVEFRVVKWTKTVAARLVIREDAAYIQVNGPEATREEYRAVICGCLRKYAHAYLHRRTEEWARSLGITYRRLAIKDTKTRWGSCSSKENINLHWKLALLPRALCDYVIVHELCHRREMNHSPRFWSLVEQVLPDYKERKAELRLVEAEYLRL